MNKPQYQLSFFDEKESDNTAVTVEVKLQPVKSTIQEDSDKLKVSLLRGYFVIYCQGLARTQTPTTKNYAPELPTFGVIAGVNQTEVQW